MPDLEPSSPPRPAPPRRRVPLADLRPATRRLLAARFVRSVGQGALAADFALYLRALGWPAAHIGLLLGATGLFGVALSLPFAVASDRHRRKPFLLAYEVLALAVAVVALLSASPGPLAAAAVAGGFGRGANGAAGPFSPSEQAWLAEEVAPERRGFVYSLNGAMGFFGMALGSVIAAGPSLWARWLPGALAFRPLFALPAVAALANLVLLGRAGERYRARRTPPEHVAPERREAVRKENRILAKLVFINGFNGLAIGLTGPLMAYWFAVRFHVGPGAIGPVMAATFAITGVASLLTGKLTERIGVVRSVVGARLVGLALLVVLPLMPAYPAASLVYFLRSAFNRGSAGARQALAIGLVAEDRRGLASSLNAVSFQLPQSAGPALAGWLIGAGLLALPFYAAAVLQAIYVVAYGRTFRHYDPPIVRRRPGA